MSATKTRKAPSTTNTPTDPTSGNVLRDFLRDLPSIALELRGRRQHAVNASIDATRAAMRLEKMLTVWTLAARSVAGEDVDILEVSAACDAVGWTGGDWDKATALLRQRVELVRRSRALERNQAAADAERRSSREAIARLEKIVADAQAEIQSTKNNLRRANGRVEDSSRARGELGGMLPDFLRDLRDSLPEASDLTEQGREMREVVLATLKNQAQTRVLPFVEMPALDDRDEPLEEV